MSRLPPAKVRKEAKLGLELRKKWKRGGTSVGVARGVQLSSGKAVSDQTIKRMYSYFQRHQHDRLDKDGSDGSIPGRGYIAWLLWGGNSGRKWAESEYKKLQGKKKNPISKPVAAVKKSLAKKNIFLIKVTLDEFRFEAWAQDMVTKEEDFEVVDNYTDNDEPIFKISEYVLAVLPKEYMQDFEFCRQMQMQGKLEKLPFSAACRAWLENDQPLDWFNEQAHDRGYIDSNEYLFLVKVNNPVIEKKSNPARNILNPEAIKKHAEGLVKTLEASDIEDKKLKNIKKWMLSNYVKGIINSDFTENYLFLIGEEDRNFINIHFFKNKQMPDWVKKAYENNEKIYVFAEEDKGFGDLSNLFKRITDIDFNHFIDFIKTSNFPNDPSRVSFDQMRELVHQWDAEDVKIKDEDKIKEGEKLYKEYADGMKWVLLTNKEAMQNESKISRMGHCIGRIDEDTGTNDYIRLVTEGKIKQGIPYKGFAFSLRDKENNPYATAFYVKHDLPGTGGATGYFNQIKGYSNCNINTATYNQVDKETRKGIQDRSCKELGEINSNQKYVADLLRDVERLKKVTGSDFDLKKTINESGSLLESFFQDSLLNIIATKASTLSDDNFYIFTSEELSSNKKIKFKNENERISRCVFEKNIISLKALPPDFEVDGDLYLNGFASLKELPAGLKVGRDLNLVGCTSLKELPAGLKVGRDLNLNQCTSLKELPADLEVGEDLLLFGCTSLQSLPPGLKVSGYLDLRRCTSLKELPAGLKVGDLNLNQCTSLKELSAGLKVNGYLNLSQCTSLKELPAGLKVGGVLDLSGCIALESLPAALEVGETLYLTNCLSLKELPAGLKVGGDLGLSYCISLKALPADLSVGGGIYLPEHLKKKENPTREEEVEAIKEYLLELARGCGKRPQKGTELYNKLRNYLTLDKAFKEKAKELCPDWFKSSRGAREETKDKMEMFLEMARNGEKKPSTSSKDAEEKKLANELVNLIYRLPEFEEKLYEANRSWTGKGKVEIIKENKEYLIELAKECGGRPSIDTDIGANLHDYLYTDIKFKEKIKELCPDWFYQSSGAKEETIAAMEMFLEMARNGEKRPSQTSKDPQEKKLGVKLSVLIARYPKFRNQLLMTAPEWFRSKERKQFLSEYKEENPLSLIARGFDERPASAYDREELKKGIKTELEHTEDAIIASKIAKDHLDEDPQYYSKLIEMESQMKQSNPARNVINVEAIKNLSHLIADFVDSYRGNIIDTAQQDFPAAIEEKISPRITKLYYWNRNQLWKNLINTDTFNQFFIKVEEYLPGKMPEYVKKALDKNEPIYYFTTTISKLDKVINNPFLFSSESYDGDINDFVQKHNIYESLIKFLKIMNIGDPYDYMSFTNSVYFPSDLKRLSLDQMIESIKKSKSYISDKVKKEEIKKGEKTYKEYSNGWKWVMLTNSSSIANEGRVSRMNHCLRKELKTGFHPYIEAVESGKAILFSLRNEKNEPFVTAYFIKNENYFYSIKGYSDKHINSENYNQKIERGVSKEKINESSPGVELLKPNDNEKYVIDLFNSIENLNKEKTIKSLKKQNDIPVRMSIELKNNEFQISKKIKNPITSSHKKIYLFSYGSNNPQQLAERLERKVKTEGAYAEDTARIFVGHSNRWNGAVASVEAQKGKTVYGLIAEVNEDDLKKMDRYEGVSSKKYKRSKIKVKTKDGKEIEAVVYVSLNTTRGKPSEEYLQAIVKTIGAHWKDSKGTSVSVKDIKTNNPITSSHEKSEEYLPIVEKIVSKANKGTDVWIDEESGDILVGTMAFEEDRSFDDVLIRIKSSGQIKEGESVDDSVRKSVQELMKKIHMALAEYVTKKPNPVPAGVDREEFDKLVEKLKKRKDVDNPYALANWILKQKNPTSYEKLLKQLQAKGVDDPKALAAWIGRQKYGKEEFQRRAAAGRRKKKGG